MEAMATMMTLGELTATAGLDDDLLLAVPLDVLGKTVHCGVKSVKRVDDPLLGFDEAVFEISLDPDLVVGDEGLMAALKEREVQLREYYDILAELDCG